MTTNKIDQMPWVLLGGLAISCLLLILKAVHLLPEQNLGWIGLEALLLGAAVFSAVHFAEVLALKVGEPFGSIILALAVTVIETALILSQMSSSSAGAEFIGRNTVYSGVMIILNGVVGLCLLVGGARHGKQLFRLDGATSALSVLATLACLTLILPNYTLAEEGPYFAVSQLTFVGIVSLILYCVFVFVQTVLHRDYFVLAEAPGDKNVHAKPASATVMISCVLLPLSLLVVVLLAKTLTGPIDAMILAAGLPAGFVGVIIALLVILPEGAAAVRAARLNQLQTSLNLALGSAIATIGLTIPTLAAYSIWTGNKLALGLGPAATTLLILTIFVSSVTLATGRTTVLQGAVHLVLFAVFMFISAFP
ncbi:MAG: ionic transporter y4hA [Aestuariivirga sp.]